MILSFQFTLVIFYQLSFNCLFMWHWNFDYDCSSFFTLLFLLFFYRLLFLWSRWLKGKVFIWADRRYYIHFFFAAELFIVRWRSKGIHTINIYGFLFYFLIRWSLGVPKPVFAKLVRLGKIFYGLMKISHFLPRKHVLNVFSSF